MGQPWGISGPQFLGLYLAGMAATLVVARVLPAAILWIPRRRISRELTTAEVGYLAGGRKRAAEVILADLVERGSWRVDSSGHVTMPDGAVGGGPYAAAAETIARASRAPRPTPSASASGTAPRSPGSGGI
jgi:uncharacterized protein (TIGR04222 family)